MPVLVDDTAENVDGVVVERVQRVLGLGRQVDQLVAVLGERVHLQVRAITMQFKVLLFFVFRMSQSSAVSHQHITSREHIISISSTCSSSCSSSPYYLPVNVAGRGLVHALLDLAASCQCAAICAAAAAAAAAASNNRSGWCGGGRCGGIGGGRRCAGGSSGRCCAGGGGGGGGGAGGGGAEEHGPWRRLVGVVAASELRDQTFDFLLHLHCIALREVGWVGLDEEGREGEPREERSRETHRETDRHIDRYTDRQTDRQRGQGP